LINEDRYATVPLYRTGGSAGPLLVMVNLNQASDTGPEIRGMFGCTILFADGETSKLLTTTLEPGYHLDRFMISATFGLNTAPGIFPLPHVSARFDNHLYADEFTTNCRMSTL